MWLAYMHEFFLSRACINYRGFALCCLPHITDVGVAGSGQKTQGPQAQALPDQEPHVSSRLECVHADGMPSYRSSYMDVLVYVSVAFIPWNLLSRLHTHHATISTN
jgi:hypothetical protein